MYAIIRVKHGVWARMSLVSRKRFHRHASGSIPQGWRVKPIAVTQNERSLAEAVEIVYKGYPHGWK